MVNRFTPKAQVALTSAKKCAEKMGHSYIGSEHLILGILSCDCMGKRILEDKRVTYSEVYNKLTEIAGTGNEDSSSIRELTPKCKKIIESSAACARRFSSKLIGTEHLLYSICEENESVGSRILVNFGINLQILKNEVATVLDAGAQEVKDEKYGISGAPILSNYARNLNVVARRGECDPLVGRDSELSRLIQVLCRRTKNNPCLIGEPGVGKTAIIEGLAQKINQRDVPSELLDKTVVSLDLSAMIAGTKYRGEFEERMRGVMNELRNHSSLILFIDEIHTIIGAGAAEGAIDAANIIKPALSRGQIQVIGATTREEYRKYIEKDAALERRFQPILVKEPSENEAINILKGLKARYEGFHRVNIPNDVIEYAVKLSVRYINDRFLPDKAIDLIDEACSVVKMSAFTPKKEIRELEDELIKISKQKENAILNESLELAHSLKERERAIKERLNLESERSSNVKINVQPTITKADIEGVVTQWTSIPVSSLEQDERQRLSCLEDALNKRVIGQENAVNIVASSIKRGRAGLKNPKRPIGSFLFLGPTGVGKTELAKAISQSVFGSEKSLIRLDMSEYMEKHSVSKLIGSPPGYVGYEEGGILTKAVKKNPYCVVLFDEIEKAHNDVYNILLQILDDGILTDAQGKLISFKNVILILTSNIGAKSIIKPRHLGFGEKIDTSAEAEKIKEQIEESLKSEFPPEFLNRLDETVVFNRLTQEDTERIVEIMLKEVKDLSKEIGIDISFDRDIVRLIAEKSFDKQYGARPIRRTITCLIENPLSEKILVSEIKKGDRVSVFCENDEIKFKCLSPV
ncbi:MAG: ATP-dependent Clp protease ATP-binding subunit [Clostridia bacterium]|nr:ATP-dependent Clp protease ATP-binding subunit [Clostridia bacterium]